MSDDVTYQLSPPVTDAALQTLWTAAWGAPAAVDFAAVLAQSLVYVCAYAGERLIGYVNVCGDGGQHAFLLDTTVHPDVRRRGVGSELVHRATEAARAQGCVWLHVDYAPHLDGFYRGCGFQPTLAGLIRLEDGDGKA